MKKQHNFWPATIAALGLTICLVFFPVKAFAVVGNVEFVGGPGPGEAISFTDEKGKETQATTQERKDERTGAVVIFIPLQGRNLPDGKYKIKWRGGETTATLGSGVNTIDFRAGGGKEPDHGFSITLQPVYEWRTIPRAGIGTVFETGVTPGHEKFQLKSENRLQWTVPEAKFGGHIFNEPVEAAIKYFQDGAKSSATEPIGGDNVAVTFHKPFSGSNGIGLGATGMNAKLDVKYQGLDTLFGLPAWLFERKIYNFTVSIGPRLVFGWDRLDFGGKLRSLTFDVTSTTNQNVKQFYGGAGIGVQKTLKVTKNIELYGGINLDLIGYHAKYNGQQDVDCVPCPLGLNKVKINTSDTDSQFAVRPSVSFGVEYEFIENSSLGLNAGYEYRSKSPELVNPPNPLKDRPPSLKHVDTNRYWVGAFYQYKFNP